MVPSLPDYESARLHALASYTILDSLPEEDYQTITRIASQLCGTPISLITLIDEQRQWFKAAVGISDRQTPREYAFCDHTIRTPDQLMEVPDARLDSRFANNPSVVNGAGVVFYAGVPLIDEEGFALGTLCVIDNKPNRLSDQQKDTLRLLARQVITLLTLRRSKMQQEATNKKLQLLNRQVQESNEVLQLVVNNCPSGLILWQAIREQGQIVDFRYLLTNPFNATVTGLSVEQMTGNTLKTLFPHVMASNILDRMIATVESGQSMHYQQYDKFDRIDMWGNYLLVPMGDRLLLTYQDISAIKKNEEQLRLYSENLEQLVAERTAEISQLSALQNAILEHAGFAIISTDLTGTIRTVNPATERLFGYPAGELIDRQSILFLYGPATLAKKAQRWSTALGRPVAVNIDLFKLALDDKGHECVMLHKDGSQLPTLLITTPLRDHTGDVIGYIMMTTDIRDLDGARNELEQKNRELNTFFEVALDLHCIATVDGAILKANRAWETTLGYTTDELLTMNHFDLLHPNDREPTRLIIGQVTPQYLSLKHTNRFRRKDGTYRIIEWNVVAVDRILYASARDITERHHSEKQLKTLNQRLQLATQAAGLGIWQYDSERDTLTWDEQTYAIHGLENTGAPLHRRDYEQLIYPEDRPSFRQRYDMLLESSSFTSTRRIQRPDGTIGYTEMYSTTLVDHTGKSTGLVGVTRDVTEHKQAELALLQSEERYRLLVDNLSEVVFQTNPGGEWTFLNPFWQKMIGYGVEQALGRPFYDFIPAADRAKSRAMFREFIASRMSSARFIICYSHQDGKNRWAEVFAQIIFDEAGQVIGTAGTIADITERKNATDALRRSEQRFRDIAENISEIFWIHSAQTLQLLYINPAYERITGLAPNTLYDTPLALLDRIPPDDQPILVTAMKRYRQGQPINIQFRGKDACNNLRWFGLKTFVKKDADGQPLSYVGVASDITGQKEKELILQQSLVKEQELNRLKSQFVATASHEFRTPLATIQSSVDLIKLYTRQPTAKTTETVQRHLGVIEKEIANFSSLLSDILTFGKIEAGKVPFSPRPTDMLGLATDLIGTHFSERADKRQVAVSVEGTPRPVYADEKLFGHVLINLLSNAFKFSDQAPALQLGFDAGLFTVIVSDTGIGIPAGEQVHLFDTFFRATNAVNIQGSGLGLVIAQQFIQQHGGHLAIQSRENEGTTCTVTLPG